MPTIDVWQDVDRLAFHENAILLDVRLRSQGVPIRSPIFDDDRLTTSDGLSPLLIRNVLDDFALVLSGHGGKDNVSAVCMEYDEEPRMITLRAASNDGINDSKLAELERLLQLITETTKKSPIPYLELKCEDVVANILRQCIGRFSKHATRFFNELKQAQCSPDMLLSFPEVSFEDVTTESSEDSSRFGSYDQTTHQAYMQLCRRRLCDLRKACATLTVSTGSPDIPGMVVLAKVAYDVRRSSSFTRFLRHNLHATKKPLAVQSMAQDLTERLGKISRFWRATTNLMFFGSIISAGNLSIQVLSMPTSRLVVRELHQRTPAHLYGRGGQYFKSCSVVQLQQKLHQLVVFYQENPQLQLRSLYIGCDKLACYLCYNFITAHEQFQMKGCHQSLYSLWTVPHTIDFGNTAIALSFQHALKSLAHALECRMVSLRKAQILQLKHRSYHESTANLSRISVQLSDRLTGTECVFDVSGSVEHNMPSQSTGIEGNGLYKISESVNNGDDPDIGHAGRDPGCQSDSANAAELSNHYKFDAHLTTETKSSHSLVSEVTLSGANGSHALRSAIERVHHSRNVIDNQGQNEHRKRRKKRRQSARNAGQGRRPKSLERRVQRYRARSEASKISQRGSTSAGPQQSFKNNGRTGRSGLRLWRSVAALLTSCFSENNRR